MSNKTEIRKLFAINANSDLEAGEKDVMNIFSVFTDQEIGMCDRGESEPIVSCKNKLDFSSKLDSFLKAWRINDQLIFYFSGHGRERNGKYFLEFGVDQQKDYYPFDNLINELENFEVYNYIIIVDACFSGNITKSNDEDKISLDELSIPKGCVFISSSSSIERSFEEEDGSGSVFTNLICKGLKTGLRNSKTKDGLIYANDLLLFLEKELHKEEYLKYKQTPKFKILDADAPIWISKNKSGKIQEQSNDFLKNGIIGNNSELRLLYEQTNKLEHPCAESSEEELNWTLIKEFFETEKREQKFGHNFKDLKEKHIFKLLRLYSNIPIRGIQYLHRSAILCFHNFPEKYYPSLKSKFITQSSKSGNIILEKEVRGPISHQIENFKNLIEDKLNFTFFDKKGNRTRSNFEEEDLIVIREIISNAFAHRDYNEPSPIQIGIFPGFIEVKNPGHFPENLKWDDFINNDLVISKPKNELITYYLSNQLKYEGIGRGFSIIRKFISKHGKESIIFKELPGNFTSVRIRIKATTAFYDTRVLSLDNSLHKSIEYQDLLERTEELQDLVNNTTDEIKRIKYQTRLEIETNRLNEFKKEVLNLAESFEKIGSQNERLKEAEYYFKEGRYEEARLTISTKNLEEEFEKLLEKKYLNENKSGLLEKSDEFLILAKLTELDYSNSNKFDTTKKYFEKSIKANKNINNLFAYGLFLQNYNQLNQAVSIYEELYAILKELTGINPEKYQTILASTLNNLGVLLKNLNEFDKANDFLRKALKIYHNLSKINQDKYTPFIAGILNNIANIQRNRNEYIEAESLFEEALEIRRKLAKTNPQSYLPDLSSTLNNLALLQSSKNELKKAELSFQEALDIRRKLANVNPHVYLPFVASTINDLAILQSNKNEFEKAELSYQEALDIYRKLAEINPQTYLSDVASTVNNLAILESNKNEFEKAELSYQEALDIYRKLAEVNPQTYFPEVASTVNNLAILESNKNEFEKAELSYQEALDIYRKLAEANPQTYLPEVASIVNNLAILQRGKNEFEKAELSYQEALNIYRKLAEANPQTYLPDVATILNNLAIQQSDIGEFEKAELSYKEALDIRRKLAKANPQTYLPEVASTINNLAILQLGKNEFEKAELSYQEALDIYRKLAEVNPQTYLPNVATILNNLAIQQSDINEFEKAELSYQEALDIYRKLAEVNPQTHLPNVGTTLINLSIYYQSFKINKTLAIDYILEAIEILTPFFHIPYIKKRLDTARAMVNMLESDKQSNYTTSPPRLAEKHSPLAVSAMLSTVVEYLAKSLNNKKSINNFLTEFTDATVDWIKPLFLKEDGTEKEVIQRLKERPESVARKMALKSVFEIELEDEPLSEAYLKEIFEKIYLHENQGTISIKISNSKNVNTGNIQTGGGDFVIGDKN